MLKDARELKGSRLQARDGELGKIKDLYFDDETWIVRYLVADTGTWLSGRKVLISPFAVQRIRADGHGVEVNLTRKQIEESPSIEMDMPVSRQFEREYHEYYNWPVYWSGPWSWGPVPCPDGLTPGVMPLAPPSSAPARHGEAHLRSVKDVTGYAIQALDNHFGHIAGFIMEEQNWAIRYLVADTRNWLPGKKVLLPAHWISSVSWGESRVYVDLDMETVKRGPAYDATQAITREDETTLFAHYGRAPYWGGEVGAARAA
jgi:hypothetical protein